VTPHPIEHVLAARPQDLADVEALEMLAATKGER
jgi:hypothetical protein